MGKSSTAVNHWMRDRGRFADLFNGVVFDGEQIVRPEDLEEARGESDILVPDQREQQTKRGSRENNRGGVLLRPAKGGQNLPCYHACALLRGG